MESGNQQGSGQSPARSVQDRGQGFGQQRAMVISQVWLGLGASSRFADMAAVYAGDIRVQCNGISADGKQILDLLSLRIRPGSDVTIIATGGRSSQAVSELAGILGGGYAG